MDISKFRIDKKKSEFSDIPETLEGQTLLERVYKDGVLVGVISIEEATAMVQVNKSDSILSPKWKEYKQNLSTKEPKEL